jgi:hypothetical protein
MARFARGDEPLVIYVEQFREYGLPYPDSESFQEIRFCPWDGAELPTSLRDEWFRRLDELGLEPEDERVPASMRTDQWWREEGI